MTADAIALLLTSPMAQELHSPLLTRLGYVGRDGYPRVIPIGYVWDGSAFIMCTAAGAPKVRALEANPRAALTIDTDEQPPHILLVRGTARVEIVEGVPTEYLGGLEEVCVARAAGRIRTAGAGLYKQMARIRIVPEWAKLIDFETTLPIAVERLVAQRKS